MQIPVDLSLAPYVLLLLIALPRAAASDGPVAVYLSKDLGVNALADVAEALDRPLDDAWVVKMATGEKRKVKTCRDFLAVAKSRFELPNAADWATWWQQGAHCFALSVLEGAKPAVQSNLGWFHFTKPGIAKLSPRLALLESPDDLDEAIAAEKACLAWGRFDETLRIKVQASDKAEIRSDGWSGRLFLYARADIDGDGQEDLLVRRDGRAIGGTAAEARVFVITQTSRAGCTRITREMGAPDSAQPP
jgi:hypothetical protein